MRYLLSNTLIIACVIHFFTGHVHAQKRTFKPYTINKKTGEVKIYRIHQSRLTTLLGSAVFLSGVAISIFSSMFFQKQRAEIDRMSNDHRKIDHKFAKLLRKHRKIRLKLHRNKDVGLKYGIYDSSHFDNSGDDYYRNQSHNRDFSHLYELNSKNKFLTMLLGEVLAIAAIPTIIGSIISYWKRFIPILILNKDGIHDEEKNYSWKKFQSVSKEIEILGDKKLALFVIKMRNGDAITIAEHEVAIVVDKAIKLVRFAKNRFASNL